jgi:hypothetical protein
VRHIASEDSMVDYAKLIDEEKARQDSAIARVEALKKRDLDLLSFFRRVEIDLGEEIAKANEELKKRGVPTILGPQRPEKNDRQIEYQLGSRKPCCRLSLESTAAEVGLSRIHSELFNEEGVVIGQTDYVIEGEAQNLKTYKSLVEGFPDHTAQVGSKEIAQEIVPGIIRGRFA